MTKRVKTFAVFLPYLAVAIGLYGFSNAWAAILMYHAGALLIIRRSSWRLLRSGWSWRVGLPLCVVCVCAGVIVYLLWPLAGRDVVMGEGLARWGLSGASWLGFAAYLTLVHPIIEELLWRADAGTDRAAIGWHDLGFAGYHALVLVAFLKVGWVGVSLGMLVVAAAMWRFAIRRAKGLGIVVLSHALADLSVMIAVMAILAG